MAVIQRFVLFAVATLRVMLRGHNWRSFENVKLLTHLYYSRLSLNCKVTLYNCLLFPLPMQDLSTATASSPQQILLLALITVGVVVTLVVVTTIVICSAQ